LHQHQRKAEDVFHLFIYITRHLRVLQTPWSQRRIQSVSTGGGRWAISVTSGSQVLLRVHYF